MYSDEKSRRGRRDGRSRRKPGWRMAETCRPPVMLSGEGRNPEGSKSKTGARLRKRSANATNVATRDRLAPRTIRPGWHAHYCAGYTGRTDGRGSLVCGYMYRSCPTGLPAVVWWVVSWVERAGGERGRASIVCRQPVRRGLAQPAGDGGVREPGARAAERPRVQQRRHPRRGAPCRAVVSSR